MTAPGPQAPPLHERPQLRAGHAQAAAVHGGAAGHHRVLLPVHSGHRPLQRVGQPRVLAVVDRHRLQVQLTLVLDDQPVGLHPPGQRGLGELLLVELGLAVRVPAVPLEPVARAQRTRLDEPVVAAPHQVVGGDVEGVPGGGVQPEHVAYAVCPGRHHRGEAVRVVDLGAHGVGVDQLTDGHQAGRGADQRVVRQAGGDLLR